MAGTPSKGSVTAPPASSGKFSSDRTIAEYAADIWRVGPCPVE
jgi:glucan phosphorylase